ncbi:hypothetical protein [Chitinophaga tropicalis]|uniref:Uncharacterized protein n=1 Tax=Chitinophaga tropicalis TaxID=2683588 RepID=A0A7K1UBL5_9BACT|nr:hypothetical protein [Chitinophaga tropicalis]MVT11782.1 hypothetical protein [Chitinophaga tropicalis]
MTDTTKQSLYDTIASNREDIASIGGGIILVKLAENLPDSNIYKSWLIILAPPFTLLLKSILSTTVNNFRYYLRKRKQHRTQLSAIQRIDMLLKDAYISNEKKEDLKEIRQQVQLSAVKELIMELKETFTWW